MSNAASRAQALSKIIELAKDVQSNPRRFVVYKDNPLGFVEEVLGIPELVVGETKDDDVIGLTPEQVAILKACVHDTRIVIRSGHGTGKSFLMGIITLWWLLCREGLVVTTSTSWEQTARVLWGAIRKVHKVSKVELPGQFFMDPPELRIEPEWYAVGLNAEKGEGFQGRHHEYLLVLVDEAAGIEENIHQAIESMATGEKNLILMVGNPTQSRGAFYESFRLDGYTKFHLDSRKHPNVIHNREIIPGAVTTGWIERQRQRWGEDSPVFASRVAGDFPTEGSNQLIPLWQVERAMDDGARTRASLQAEEERQPTVLSLDVARYGSNLSVLAVRKGDAILHVEGWQGVATTETTRKALDAYNEWGADVIVVDGVGVGGGVVDQLLAVKGVNLIDFHAGSKANDKQNFNNLRSEAWWHLRERLYENRVFLPTHETLKRDLTAPNYDYDQTGRVRIERKEQMERRGYDSPDFGDAIMMAFAVDFQQLPPARVRMDDTKRDPAIFVPFDENFPRPEDPRLNAPEWENAESFGGMPLW